MGALRRFVDEMRTLERDRRGKAQLIGTELHLSFTVVDHAGHVHLDAALSQIQAAGEFHVAAAFAVDPTTLPRILSDFEDLLDT